MGKVINGIDVDVLMSTVDAIKKNPDIAKCRFRVSDRWLGGTNNRATVQGFYGALKEHPDRAGQREYEIDEPQELQGHDKGPNPVEYVLIALVG